jgi:hypothetical protein
MLNICMFEADRANFGAARVQATAPAATTTPDVALSGTAP